MTENDLIQELAGMGVHVVYLPYRLAGAYWHDEGLIVIDSRQTRAGQLAALAHETIHARRGDSGPQPSHVEDLVDELAAKLLISPIEYALAERVYGSRPAALAAELGVTQRMVEAWRRGTERGWGMRAGPSPPVGDPADGPPRARRPLARPASGPSDHSPLARYR